LKKFKNSPSYETWDPVFECADINTIFNSFLNTYIRNFYFSLPLIKINEIMLNNFWIVIGIKTSCQQKSELYIASRNSNNSIIKKYYKTYCKIQVDVIEVAKRLYYDNQINSTNKIETTWKIVNLETCRKASNAAIESLNIDGRIISNQQHIADAFNSYFLSIAD
jgi:hypothetical protein